MNPAGLPLRDLRRLVRDMWDDPRCDAIAPATLDAALAANAKSCDRAVITGYLDHFPTDHPAFGQLARATAQAASRRDWPWRERGERWRLWDREIGPSRLADALLASDDPAALLREAGLDGDLAEGEFVADALGEACEQAAQAKGDRAVTLGERLIALFERLSIGGQDAALARALLKPWTGGQPPDSHRDRVSKLLVGRIGDPRLKAARWETIATEMEDSNAGRLVAMIRRWLTQRTVRQFFDIVGAATNDPAQWAQREKFWLAYLDDGAIEDAWFAFGRQAEWMAGQSGGDKLLYGEITGGGADPSHSALIMSIGEVRIAEWSHNGSCRFWNRNDRQAPELFQKQYFGMQLRAMNGGRGFEDRFAAIPHASGWQRKFAGFVHHFANRLHPIHGGGSGWTSGYRSSADYRTGGTGGWG